MKESQKYDKKSLKSVIGKSAHWDELAKDCVAFANRDGGHLAIGIENDDELPPATQRIPPGLQEDVVKHINERTYNYRNQIDCGLLLTNFVLGELF